MLVSTKDQSIAICYAERVKARYYNCGREAELDNSFNDEFIIVLFANRHWSADDVRQTNWIEWAREWRK